MDINYDIIIKYLCKKNSIKKEQDENQEPEIQEEIPKLTRKTFSTQKSIFNYATNFPDKFKDLLTDKFYRYGVTTYDMEKNNVSFWASLLTLIDKNFLIPYNNDELSMISMFKNNIIDMYKKSMLSSFLKEFDKNDIRERFKLEPDVHILQYVVDILDVNFMIFNFETETIESIFKKDMMNPWKQTLMFAKYDNLWEPIMLIKAKGTTQRLVDYNNMNFKKIIANEKLTYFEGDKIKKDYICYDNINDVVEMEHKRLFKITFDIMAAPENEKLVSKLASELGSEFATNLIDCDSESSVKTESDIFVQKDELDEIKKLNKTQLTKMKLEELSNLVTKLKITVTEKKPTKAIYINSILNKIAN